MILTNLIHLLEKKNEMYENALICEMICISPESNVLW